MHREAHPGSPPIRRGVTPTAARAEARGRGEPAGLRRREPDDGQEPVGLLLVAGEPGHGRDDALPGGIAFRAGELGRLDVDGLAADLDLRLVGVGGEVVVSGGMRGRAGRRGDDQPRVVAVGHPAEEGLPLLAGLGATERRTPDRADDAGTAQPPFLSEFSLTGVL